MWNRDCRKCTIKPRSIFADIHDCDLEEMDSKKITTLYKKGQCIFYAGQSPIGIYCLNEGYVKIAKIGKDGKEQIVRFATHGGLLGIRALIGGRKYSATSTAIEDSMVCFINKKTFFKLTLKYPKIARHLMKSLSKLLEEAEEKMISLAQKPVRERVAESLLILNSIFETGRTETIELPGGGIISLSREDIANLVGTATETLIRVLSDFKEENLIEIRGRKIILSDIFGLKKVANNIENPS